MITYEFFKINCNLCKRLLYNEYTDLITKNIHNKTCGSIFSCNKKLYCIDCIIFCESCNTRVEKDNNSRNLCNECFIKYLIKNTHNTITSKLPVELVNLIIKFV